MKTIIPFNHFCVMIIWDPKHKPQHINNSGNNKQKSYLVFFILEIKNENELKFHKMQNLKKYTYIILIPHDRQKCKEWKIVISSAETTQCAECSSNRKQKRRILRQINPICQFLFQRRPSLIL